MFISYDANNNWFVYKTSESKAERFCSTASSLYAIDNKGCMFRSSGNIVLKQDLQDCAKTDANIYLKDTNTGSKLLKNGQDCARAQGSDLSSKTDGTTLTFTSECNDSRLPFTLVTRSSAGP